MENVAASLCPNCIHCPEVVIEGETVRIGEDANTAILTREEWNILVDLIQSGQLGRLGGSGKGVGSPRRPLKLSATFPFVQYTFVPRRCSLRATAVMPDEPILRAQAREALQQGRLPTRPPDRTW